MISPESFDLEGYPISTLTFKDWEHLDVNDVLTQIKRWSTYSQEYLEGRVNNNLGEYLEEAFGVKVSKLRKNMGFSTSEVGVDVNSIRFPGGVYVADYIADDKKSGKLILSLSLESEWFARPSDISSIVDSLGMVSEEMVLELIKPIQPESLIPGLEAKGWEICSQLGCKIIAKASTYTLIATHSQITFRGFSPKELFGDKSDKEKAKIASNALALIIGKV